MWYVNVTSIYRFITRGNYCSRHGSKQRIDTKCRLVPCWAVSIGFHRPETPWIPYVVCITWYYSLLPHYISTVPGKPKRQGMCMPKRYQVVLGQCDLLLTVFSFTDASLCVCLVYVISLININSVLWVKDSWLMQVLDCNFEWILNRLVVVSFQQDGTAAGSVVSSLNDFSAIKELDKISKEIEDLGRQVSSFVSLV